MLVMTMPPLIQHIPQPQSQHLPTGLHGDLVLLIVVLVLFEAEHERAILNTVQVYSKKVKRALSELALQISTSALPMLRAQNGGHLFYNIKKMVEFLKINTIASGRQSFNSIPGR